MIKNEKQLKITKGLIKKFEKALQELKILPESKKQPWLRTAQRNSILSQLDQLYQEVEEYQAIKSGKIKITLPSIDAIMELPALLIKRRIANGWTQEKLAQKLDMHAQQIQRYEQTDYASASLATIQQVAAALSDIPVRSKSSGRGGRHTARGKISDKTSKRKALTTPSAMFRRNAAR